MISQWPRSDLEHAAALVLVVTASTPRAPEATLCPPALRALQRLLSFSATVLLQPKQSCSYPAHSTRAQTGLSYRFSPTAPCSSSASALFISGRRADARDSGMGTHADRMTSRVSAVGHESESGRELRGCVLSCMPCVWTPWSALPLVPCTHSLPRSDSGPHTTKVAVWSCLSK